MLNIVSKEEGEELNIELTEVYNILSMIQGVIITDPEQYIVLWINYLSVSLLLIK